MRLASENNFINPPPSSYRIAPVDGLRTVAVLGVVWAHVWLFCGNPAWSIGKIGSVNLDLHRSISMIGTGVDLFFVISGFCMYLMYARKQTKFEWGAYVTFLKKRWLRIAPAFYVAAFVCAIAFLFFGRPFPWLDLLAHASFTHIWLPNTNGLAPPFWSLATEWHFYLILPLFIWAAARFGFWPVAAIAILASTGFRLWMYSSPADIEVFWNAQLPSRLVEFAWGMCVARLYTLQKVPPKVLRAERGLLIAFVITYFGRLLMVTEVVNLTGSFGYICKTMAEPILTLGYSLILWNVVSSESIFQKLLSHTSVQAMGRWSYSLYLWHWWPCLWIGESLVNHFGSSPLTQNLALILSLAVLIPFSWLSYSFLEAPYFRWQQSKKPA